jgi:hypothetical protein
VKPFPDRRFYVALKRRPQVFLTSLSNLCSTVNKYDGGESLRTNVMFCVPSPTNQPLSCGFRLTTNGLFRVRLYPSLLRCFHFCRFSNAVHFRHSGTPISTALTDLTNQLRFLEIKNPTQIVTAFREACGAAVGCGSKNNNRRRRARLHYGGEENAQFGRFTVSVVF